MKSSEIKPIDRWSQSKVEGYRDAMEGLKEPRRTDSEYVDGWNQFRKDLDRLRKEKLDEKRP